MGRENSCLGIAAFLLNRAAQAPPGLDTLWVDCCECTCVRSSRHSTNFGQSDFILIVIGVMVNTLMTVLKDELDALVGLLVSINIDSRNQVLVGDYGKLLADRSVTDVYDSADVHTTVADLFLDNPAK